MLLVTRRSLAGFCAAGAIAIVAGCGGGGDDSSGGASATSGSLSAAEFRTQADAICQTSKDTLAGLTEPTPSSSGADVATFLTAGLDATDAEIAQLRALDAPADLAGTLDQALDLLEQRQTRIRAVADRVAAGEDFDAVIGEANDEIDTLNNQADAKAKELGLTVCGTPVDSGASATTGTGTTTAPATGDGTSAAQVSTDLKAAQAALVGVSTSLQSASGTSLDDLKAVVPDAQKALGEFDDAIAKLASDSSPNAAQEKVRAAVATTGPKVSDVLGRLLEAIQDGDEAAATALVPEVQKVFAELQTAFAG